jgi:hypothetical protein
VFSPEEEVALLNHLSSSPRLRESHDLAVFLLDTGARINEALTTTSKAGGCGSSATRRRRRRSSGSPTVCVRFLNGGFRRTPVGRAI